jgi:hypothetical protein
VPTGSSTWPAIADAFPETYTDSDLVGPVVVDHAAAINAMQEDTAANRVFNVVTYGGAVGNGIADDVTPIRNTLSAAGLVGGTVIFPPGYTFRTSDHISSHLVGVKRIIGYGATITATSTLGGGIRRGIFDVHGCSNLLIEGLTFSASIGNSLLCISGSTDITVYRCVFTGDITGQAGIEITTQESTNAIKNITVHRCVFREINETTAQRAGVELYTNAGRTITNVTVDSNHFERIYVYGVKITAGDGLVRMLKVTNNGFVDMEGPATSGGAGIGFYATAVAGGVDYGSQNGADPPTYQVRGVLVQGNDWLSSRNNETAIFCHVQGTVDLRVLGNSAIHTGDDDDSNFIAPGRVTLPQYGLVIADNYAEGFGAWWDPDSMYYAKVYGNTAVNCNPNGGLSTPYAQAKYVDIFDNTFVNSYESVTADAAISTGIPSGAAGTYVKVKVHDNMIADTQATPVINKFIYVFGSATDVSEVSVYDNSVHVPNGTVTGGATLQNASNTPPLIMYPNEIHDSAGRKPVGPIPSVASAATIALPSSADFFDLTGTTSITSITASWVGRRVTLRFPSGSLTLTDGSNLQLAGSLTSSATGNQDTISLLCDGTNWIETGRSVN